MIGARTRYVFSTIAHLLAVRRQDWRERTLWCLDLETGGLDATTDAILSIGMVPIRNGVIALGDSYHVLVQPEGPITRESLKVHQILPRDLDGAVQIEDTLPEVRARLESGVLVVHQRSVDVPFLRRAYRSHGQTPPVFAIVDTVELLLRYARRHGHLTPERTRFPTGLSQARTRFGLPPHRAHEALSDAVATAELFLVLAHRLNGGRLSALL